MDGGMRDTRPGSRPTKPPRMAAVDRRRPHDMDRRAASAPEATASPEIAKPSAGRAAMIYGLHPVAMAWTNPARRCLRLYATAAGAAALGEPLARATALGLKRPALTVVERDVLERLLPPLAVHQGVALDAEPLPELGLEDVLIAIGDEPATLVILDQVTDPHNVGAILRSAAAFGARGMIVQSRRAPEMSGVLAKAASGAAEIVPILRETNLSRAIERLHEAGFSVIGLAEGAAQPIETIAIGARTALALGAEGEGLRRLVAEHCDVLAALPTEPPIGSLNVSNAAAIGLYEIARRKPRSTASD
jgi:23S rRNA (guanosine2251-2'-O)-methyltransferase